MKHFLFSITILITHCIYAQQDLSKKEVLFFEKNQLSITNYKFDNETVNQNIKKSLNHHKNQKITGLISIPAGLVWLGYTAYVPAKSFIDNRKSDTLIPTTTNNTYFILSTTLFVATSSLIITHILQKEKRDKSLKLIQF